MGRKIKVVQCGIGTVGKQIVRAMLSKEYVEVVGAVTRKTGLGQDLGEAIGIDNWSNCR